MLKCFGEKELTASFEYNGEKKYITAGTHCFEAGLCAVLELTKVTEEADHLLLKLKNTGTENSYQIKNAKTLDLHVITDQKAVYHGLTGDDCGAASFLPVDKNIDADYHEEPQGGRSSNNTGFPYFDISWGEQAAVFAIGWTGQWSKDILALEDGFGVQLGLKDSDFYLVPGEEIRLASVLIVKGEGAADTRRRFRQILKEHYTPKTYLGEQMYVPTSIQCFDRYFQGLGNGEKNFVWATEEGQIITADAAKKVKYLDTLWLDAAWFEGGFPYGVGNFSYAKGFPNGLKPVSDYVHEKGMKFVLWFEPERVTRGTELYEKPEKLLKFEQNEFKLLNLADKEVCGWLKDKLTGMIRENGIDVYRQDFNMDPLPYWRAQDEENRKGITEIKYISGLYDLWDALLAEFPQLLIDNCSSGGRRLDLETSKRSITLWKSDTGCFPETKEQRVNMWSQNQTLSLSEYLPYHACAIWDTDAYTVRSNSTQGVACNFDVLDPAFDFSAAEKISAEIDEMKKYWDGDFYPMSPSVPDETIWAMFQLALEDCGAVYAFRREFCDISQNTIVFSAVEENQTYRLTFIDEKQNRTEKLYTGKELKTGILAEIPESRNSLIIFVTCKS